MYRHHFSAHRRTTAHQFSRFLLATLLIGPVLAHAGQLTLSDAESEALKTDPVAAAASSRAEALDLQAVADGQLPDPKLRTGLYNLPSDDFDLDREPTTQLRIGIVQSFPRGDTLARKSERSRAQARAQRARASVARHQLLRDVRDSYLDIFLQQASGRIVESSRSLFENLVEVTQDQYGAGNASQQDVLRAELELSRLEDRLTRIRNDEEKARARLSRWIGELAWGELVDETPSLAEPPDAPTIEAALPRHPEIALRDATIESHERAVEIAREQFKPGWAVGAEYRKRFGDNPDGSDRTDMLAVMLTVDLPLFTEKRQDKRLEASRKQADAAMLDRRNTLRLLRQRLATDTANRKRLEERIARYEAHLLREASENADAALLAYQSGTTDFTALMRARITELDVRLQALKLRVALLKTRADLLYLASGAEK